MRTFHIDSKRLNGTATNSLEFYISLTNSSSYKLVIVRWQILCEFKVALTIGQSIFRTFSFKLSIEVETLETVTNTPTVCKTEMFI